MQISFFVEGCPAPKGSMKAIHNRGRAFVINSSSATAKWENLVRKVAKGFTPAAGLLKKAVAVTASFHFVRKLKKDGKPFKGHEGDAPTFKIDLDKLLRCICDALTGVLYEDDGQVTEAIVCKVFCTKNMPAGAYITVRGIS